MAAFHERLTRELTGWVAEGLVTAAQAEAIRARYRDAAAEERRGRVVVVLALVGAIVVGLGVILFFAANWDTIPRWTRLLLLVAAIVAAYAGADRLRDLRPAIAHALAVLGVILFGTSVFLVGQMYNVSTHDPLAFLLWSGAAVSMALIWRSTPLATLSIVLLAAWQGHELFFTLSDSQAGAAVGPLAVLYGSALYALGTAFAPRLQPLGFAKPMRGFGVLFASAPLFVFSFENVTRDLRKEHPLDGRAAAFAVALAATTMLGVAALGRARGWEGAGVAAVAVLGLLPALVEVHRGFYVVAFGLLALGAIAAGVEADEEWLVNLGVLFVGIELFARFFDLFGRMLARSGAFVLTGALLLALAWTLERGRSHLVGRMRA
jgi:uncharacterized membrane protein